MAHAIDREKYNIGAADHAGEDQVVILDTAVMMQQFSAAFRRSPADRHVPMIEQ